MSPLVYIVLLFCPNYRCIIEKNSSADIKIGWFGSACRCNIFDDTLNLEYYHNHREFLTYILLQQINLYQ